MQGVRFLFALLLLAGMLVQLYVDAKGSGRPQPRLADHVNKPAAGNGNTGPFSVDMVANVNRHPSVSNKLAREPMQTRSRYQLIKRAGSSNQGRSASTSSSRLPPRRSRRAELSKQERVVLGKLTELIEYFNRPHSLNVRRLYFEPLKNDVDLLGLVLTKAKRVLARHPNISADFWASQCNQAERAHEHFEYRLRMDPGFELHLQRTEFIDNLKAALNLLSTPVNEDQARAREILDSIATEDDFIFGLILELDELGISAPDGHAIPAFVPTRLTFTDEMAISQVQRVVRLSAELDYMGKKVEAHDVFEPRSSSHFLKKEREAKELMADIEAGAELLRHVNHPASDIGESVVQSLKNFLHI